MRNSYMFIAALAFPLCASAESYSTPPTGVTMINSADFNIMSSNGEWIGGKKDECICLYNTKTGEIQKYESIEMALGIGNSIANNGMAVGEENDHAVIIKDGEVIYPEPLLEYYFCDINAITSDGTRITGTINNPEPGPIGVVPFVADIDENGNVSNIVIPDYPKEDLFGSPPQYVKANWISNDGKTILGEVTDFRGRYPYPVIYKETAAGEWSYILPSEPLFNPEGLYLPPNPQVNEPEYPEPEAFMSGLLLSAYQAAYAKWVDNGAYADQEPDIYKYMTDEQAEKYNEAARFYNTWYYSTEEAQYEYNIIYQQVLATSPVFGDNDSALHPDGEFIMTHAFVLTKSNEEVGKIYRFDCDGMGYVEYDIPRNELYPKLILSNGLTLLELSRWNLEAPITYMLKPGSTEVVSVLDILKPDYTDIVSWITSNFAYGCGTVVMNDDMSVITGSVNTLSFTNFTGDEDAVEFYTYVLKGLDISGVETIEGENKDGVIRVYNLQGVKVMQTKDASTLRDLPKGIYIVNGKKIKL